MSIFRFLFLEDKLSDAKLIINAIKSSGTVFEYVIVEDESTFKDALRDFIPDLVFADYNLSSYNGLLAIKEITENHPNIPIIIVTRSIDELTAVDCMKSGASDYILKDNLARLGKAAKDALETNKLKKENHEALQLLKENEQSYRILVEQAGDAIFKGDLDGNFIQVNTTACELTGFSRKELLSMNMKEIFSESQLNIVPFEYEALNKGESVINKRDVTTKSGDIVPIEMNSKRVDDNSYLSIIRDLSARIKIEKELKDHQNRLRNIIEHTSNLFYLHTLDGKLTYVSPQTRSFFDCEPEEMLHKHTSFFTENPINKIGEKATQKAIETGEVQPPFELELIGKKGRKIWVEVHESPVIENGLVTGIVGALIDITEWKSTFNKLVSNEEKFRKLFSEAPDGVLLINSKGTIIDCNQAYCNLLESEKDDVINTHVSDSICKKDLLIFKDAFPSLITTGKSEGEICLTTKNNRVICTRRTASALYNEIGEFSGAIVHTNDISEQKKIQDQVKKREARLSAIFKAADNMSFILSSVEGKDSTILEFSPGSENIFGYKKSEIIGKPVKLLHTPDTIKNFTKYLNKMKKGEEGFKGQTLMVKKSGEKFIASHTAYPVFDDNNNLVQALGVTIDISKLIETEEAVKKLEAQLRHSQKMEAIGLMASGIAHNFNNILQAIVGYIDFAKEGLTESEQRYKDIDQISQHVKRATILTKDMLAVGKEQFMRKGIIDLNDVISPIVHVTNRITSNNIEIKFDPATDLPAINADGSQIDQVVMNIIINARDAMEDGGLIEISTQNVNLDANLCSANAWAIPGDYALITISDTGHGMDSDTQRRIFEPYFTTKDLDKGTGLGLSTSFGIISQHNGLVNVISEINKGTTFEVYLPIIDVS